MIFNDQVKTFFSCPFTIDFIKSKPNTILFIFDNKSPLVLMLHHYLSSGLKSIQILNMDFHRPQPNKRIYDIIFSERKMHPISKIYSFDLYTSTDRYFPFSVDWKLLISSNFLRTIFLKSL